jgi:hypothetical protein
MKESSRKEYVMIAMGDGIDGKDDDEGKDNKIVDQIGYDELLKQKKAMFDPTSLTNEETDSEDSDDEASFYNVKKKKKKKKRTVIENAPSSSQSRGGWCKDLTKVLTGRGLS